MNRDPLPSGNRGPQLLGDALRTKLADSCELRVVPTADETLDVVLGLGVDNEVDGAHVLSTSS